MILLERAILTAEDRRFYYHFGIDPVAVLRAMFVNLKEKRRAEGGSTITQQLARTLYNLGMKKTLRRKLVEATIAVYLELKYSKRRILDLYVQSVYMGHKPDGTVLVGLQAASKFYFGKPTCRLSPAQTASLVCTLKAPNIGFPGTEVNKRRTAQLMEKLKWPN